MGRLVILDPSIKKTGGHYLEYANRVFDAAAKLGMETCIVANIEYSKDQGKSAYEIMPWFRRDFWENEETVFSYNSRRVGALKKLLHRSKRKFFCFLTFNPLTLHLSLAFMKTNLGLALSSGVSRREQLKNIAHRILRKLCPQRPTLLLYFFQYRVLQILFKWAHVAIVVLARLLVKALKLAAAIAAAPFLLFYFLYGYLIFKNKPFFSTDLEKLFDKNVLKAGDIIFIPSAGLCETRGVADLLSRRPKARNLSWRLLFRRDVVYEGRPAGLSPIDRARVFAPLRLILRRLKKAAQQVDICFYTDTDELTYDYNMLGLYSFQTTTIPVDERLRYAPPPQRPLPILYIGDARNEKGFPELPHLIERTLDMIADKRITYQCQSNFNIPGGEAASAAAMSFLRTRQAISKVELVPGPLDDHDYNRLIRSAGIILLPYKRENYQARSSGIFAEAVAAGVPCLVTAGTSMARLAEPSRQKYFSLISQSATFEAVLSKSIPLSDLITDSAEACLSLPAKPGKSLGNVALYLQIAWQGIFTEPLFMQVKVSMYDLRGESAGELVQTIAIFPGLAGSSLLKVHGISWKVKLGFATKQINVSRKNIFTVTLRRSASPVPVSGGICMFENREDMLICFRDMVEHYEHYRQSMKLVSEQLWPKFSPARLVEQLSVTSDVKTTMQASIGPKILFLTDVSLGYGSPQVPSLAESLGRFYQGQVLILEKDEGHKPPLRPDFLSDNVHIERLFGTSVNNNLYFAQYAEQALFYLDAFKPDIFVSSFMEPLLYMKGVKDHVRTIILHYLEYGSHRSYKAVRGIAGSVDLIIFPEEHRARLEFPRLGLSCKRTESVIMHNSRLFKTPPPEVAPQKRNGRFIYAGGFWERTKARWLLDARCAGYSLDIFGGGGEESLFRTRAKNYCGYLPSDDIFFATLANYNYSLVLWAPGDDDTYYCAPNKLYDALVCGVPFVSGPHPLCVKLASKYNCGIIMNDWTVDDFVNTLDYCQSIMGTRQYAKLVQGCRNAMKNECDWNIQFEALAAKLPPPERFKGAAKPTRKKILLS